MSNIFVPSERVTFKRVEFRNECHYFINETHSRNIKFSQLNGVYIKPNSQSVYCCSISTSDGIYQICRLSESDFWQIVKDREFMVIIDNNTLQINCEDGLALDKAQEVFSLIDQGKEMEANKIGRASCRERVSLCV